MEEKEPTHKAYLKVNGDAMGFWMEIGTATPHKDGRGFDVVLNELPPDGRIVVMARDAKPKDEE